MSKYQQATRLQGVHYDVRGRNMVEAQRMVAEGQRVLHLNIGNLADKRFVTTCTGISSCWFGSGRTVTATARWAW